MVGPERWALEVGAVLNYYIRAGLSAHLSSSCTELLRKRPDDAMLQFWRCYALVMENSYSEALRELSLLQGKREVELCVLLAMVHAHRSARIIDEEAVAVLETRIVDAEARASEPGLVEAATLLWHLGSYQRSMSMAEKVLRTQPNSVGAKCLLAWVSITPNEDNENVDGGPVDAYAAQAVDTFSELAGPSSTGKRSLESLMGIVHSYELTRQFDAAFEVITRISTDYAWFLPALVVKARLLMQLRDWDSVLETVQHVLAQDEGNVEALEILMVYTLTQESSIRQARSSVDKLAAAVSSREPRNAPLYYRLGQTAARLAAGDASILKTSLKMLGRARDLVPHRADLATEQGHQMLQLGDVKRAGDLFHEAQSIDELNMGGVYGSIEYLICEGKLDDAKEQLEFLKEMVIGDEKPAKLMYFSGVVASRELGSLRSSSTADAATAAKLVLDDFTESFEDHMVHLEKISARALTSFTAYATELDVPFLLDLSRECLMFCSGTPRAATEAPIPAVLKAKEVLDVVTSTCPGTLAAQLLHAKASFYDGDHESAIRVAAACIEHEPSYVDAYIMLAQVYIHQGKVRMAEQTIEQAMGHNFVVKESPVYYIVRAMVLQGDSNLEEALKMLEMAMTLPCVKAAKLAGAAGPREKKKSDMQTHSFLHDISRSDMVTLYLLLAKIHQELGQMHEAVKVIEDASSEFAGSSEETRVVLANCDLVLARGDTAEALETLGAIPAGSPHFVQAKSAMAQVYLKHNNDKAMFAKCYEELVQQHPTVQSYCTLGDALLQIQEPDKAIAAFESAYRLEPNDASLASRLGKALIATHDYTRAVNYYVVAMENSEDTGIHLQIELAELYVKIKKFDEASRTVDNILRRFRAGGDISETISNVRALLLLASIHDNDGNGKGANEARAEAKELQLSLLQKIQHEQPEELEKQRRLAADICFMLGSEANAVRKYEESINLFHEGLELCESHTKSMLSLSKIHLLRNEIAEAQNQCTSILRYDPDNEEATIMLAELMFQKEMYETSIYHYEQLLERKPAHYRALSKLIQLMRRAGRLEEVPQKLTHAERAAARAAASPGLHFCRGLYLRYRNDPREALKEFNSVRNSGEWGVEATFQMVEIYINPDNESIGGLASADRDVARESSDAAMQLLDDVRNRKQHSARFAVLEAYAMMASGEKAELEQALQILLGLAQSDSESVPVLLALASAYTILKQVPKARNQLKRVAKMAYNVDEADEFEKSWLMLAEVHIQAGKFDLAHEMCVRCIKYNKSCARAWEHMGAIMEREQSYANAAENYENAWKHDNEAVSRVGYKLAFNLLKCKDYVRAIDVCHKVLAVDSEYPKIRQEVLEKAWAGLRP